MRHFVALERVFDEAEPDVVVPEVGSETMRTVAHLVGRDRGATVFFLFYTIFPRPLRLYADDYHKQIVPQGEVREPTEERDEVETFIRDFTSSATPILAHRRSVLNRKNLRDFARHTVTSLTADRDNEYLRPSRFVSGYVRTNTRRIAARRHYEKRDPSRPFVYFPLHVTEDFKVKRVIPHCADQEYIVKQVADALPQGYDLVLKEHPVSIGRNPSGMLRRLTQRENVRLVSPCTSSHELIREAAAVIVIQLDRRPRGAALRPAGADDGSAVLLRLRRDPGRRQLPRAARGRSRRPPVPAGPGPDASVPPRCDSEHVRGRPGGVDPSDENAARLAASLDEAARDLRAGDAAPEVVGAG